MSDWRDLILDCFAPNVSALNIVTDPDILFSEEKLVSQLKEKSFDLIEFKDSIEFRFFYESNYREKEQSANDLIVVLSGNRANPDLLPYDLLTTGKTFHFSLSDIFPNFNYPVIQQIDKQHFDVLFNAPKLNQERMGENATKDFILRHVFKISSELISTDIDLLQMLLRLHYSNLSLPEILSKRLIDVLNALGKFQQWPLDEILVDEQTFYAFLQEKWPVFLDALKGEPDELNEDLDRYGLKFSGPGILPFGHQDILVYIDNLFVERKLEPIIDTSTNLDLTSWIKTGVKISKNEDGENRLQSLLDILERQLPSEQSRHSDWTSFALKKAEFEALRLKSDHNFKKDSLNELENKIETRFSIWFEKHFPGLMSLPPTHPVMLHHIPRQMARYVEASNEHRVALIVVDGLSLDQWVTVRENIESQLFLHGKNLILRETGVFAWIPSLTSVSRQALFAGKPPLYFPGSIHSTHNEKKLWQQFWENYGLSRFDVGFKKSLGNEDIVTVLDDLNLEKIKAIGLVIDTVDKIMHGMQLGNAGMHDQIRLWCQKGYLSSLISHLFEKEFQVWLTSDHGNIECIGMGNPGEGVIAETRGERARVYSTQQLRSQVAERYPDTVLWDPVGLPQNYYPLLAKGTNAFLTEGKKTVTHGGVSLQEVVVPLIKFETCGSSEKKEA